MADAADTTPDLYDPKDSYIGEHYLNGIENIIRRILDTDKVQPRMVWGIAYVTSCWQTFEKRHLWDDDAIPMHSLTLRDLFGHNYKQVMAQFFERGGRYDKDSGVTRPLKPRQRYREEVKKMKAYRHTGQLMQFNGKTIEKAKRRRALVIAEKQHKKGINFAVEKHVPVNLEALHLGFEALQQWINHFERSTPAPDMYRKEIETAREYLARDPLQRNLNELTAKWLNRRLLQMQDVIAGVSKAGTLQQQYKLPSGTGTRYCGIGLSLQNVGKLVRNTALAGFYGHDIEACHHRIIESYAINHDLPHDTISAYIANKSDWRCDLADYLDVPESIAKVILIATINGWQGKRKDCDIFDYLKAAGVERLFSYPAYAGMFDEFRVIRASMLETAPYSNRKKATQNAKGFWIFDLKEDGKRVERSKPELYAFLLQGIEMLALEAALKAHSDEGYRPLIGIHDGWITAHKGQPDGAIEAMKIATGIRFKIKSKRVSVSGLKLPQIEE